MTEIVAGSSSHNVDSSMNDKRPHPWRILDQHANAIVEKLIECALSGDLTALRICMERIIPRSKVENSISFQMPNGSITSGDNMLQITNNLTEAVTAGEMTIAEANKFSAFLRQQRRVVEDEELKIQRGW